MCVQMSGGGRFLSEPKSPHNEIFVCENGVAAIDRSFSGIPAFGS